jgi:hypothetical protein
MMNANTQIEKLELTARDEDLPATVHWDRTSRAQSRRRGQALRKAAKAVRDAQFAQAA